MEGVSVIICCYNSALRLPATLKHLALQEGLEDIPWEVIVVNNASKDNTAIIATSEWSKYRLEKVGFKVVDDLIIGLSHARQKGIDESKFEYIIFCDDDNWLSQNYILRTYNIFRSNPNIGITGGQSKAIFETEKPFWFDEFHDHFAVGKQGEMTGDVTSTRGWLWGAGMGLRKKVFEKLKKGNFAFALSDRTGSKLISGHDVEICFVYKLLGFRLYYDEDLLLFHYIPNSRINWEYLSKLNKNGGVGAVMLLPFDLIFKNQKFSFLIWLRKSFIYCCSLLWNLFYYIRLIRDEKAGDAMVIYIYRRISFIENYLSSPFYLNKRTKELNKIKNHASQKPSSLY